MRAKPWSQWHWSVPAVRLATVIQTREDLRAYLSADLAAHGVSRWALRQQLAADNRVPVIRFQRRLRRIEYLVNARPRLSRVRLAVLWRVHLRHASHLGFTIPINVFGPGLCIAHFGTITVNPGVRVGARCRIHPSTTIGRVDDGTPTIGDDCYIGPGARVLGGITLGSRVTIGANAVVRESFPPRSALAGVPTKQIGLSDLVWRH